MFFKINPIIQLLIFLLFFNSCSSTKNIAAECHPVGNCSRFQRPRLELPPSLKWKLFESSFPSVGDYTKPYKAIFAVDQSTNHEINRQQFEQFIYDKNDKIKMSMTSIFTQNESLEKEYCKNVHSKILNQNHDELLYEIHADQCQSLISSSEHVFIIGKILEMNNAFAVVQYRAEKNKETEKYIPEAVKYIKKSNIEEISKWEVGVNLTLHIFTEAVLSTLRSIP